MNSLRDSAVHDGMVGRIVQVYQDYPDMGSSLKRDSKHDAEIVAAKSFAPCITRAQPELA